MNFTIAKSKSLANLLCTTPRMISEISAKADQQPWPAGTRPQGLFISIADEIRDNTVGYEWTKEEVRIRCRIATFGERTGRWEQPPYYFIGVFAPTPTGPAFELAYAHPIAGGFDGLPVDSAYERRTAHVLRKLCKYLKDQNICFGARFWKPLFDMGAPPGVESRSVCRPDFVLDLEMAPDHQSRRIIVETIGSKGAAYRASKDVTRPLMMGHGVYVEHRPLDEGKPGRDGRPMTPQNVDFEFRSRVLNAARTGRHQDSL